MSARTRNVWIVGLALLTAALVALGVLWFRKHYHQVEKTFYLPPGGEAAYNPLYALAATLEADGVRVNARQRLQLDGHALSPRDTLLLFNDPRGLSPPEVRRLLAWVEQGGHLVVRTPDFSWGKAQPDAPLMRALSLVPLERAARCEDFQVEGEDHHVEFCRGRRFTFDEVEPQLAWGDLDAGYVYTRLRHGRGHVDVLAQMDFLTNGGDARPGDDMFATPPVGGLRDGPHRALARQVLAPNYGRGTMHLVYAVQMPSLMRTVLSRGWMVWLPLLLALSAWLWARTQRFGPALPSPPAERRSLLEHVRASGEHLYRYGRGVLLYTAVRQAFLARLRRRDPVAAALTGEVQAAAIAERLGVPVERVRTALLAPASHDRPAFRDRISTLIQLRNRL